MRDLKKRMERIEEQRNPPCVQQVNTHRGIRIAGEQYILVGRGLVVHPVAIAEEWEREAKIQQAELLERTGGGSK